MRSIAIMLIVLIGASFSEVFSQDANLDDITFTESDNYDMDGGSSFNIGFGVLLNVQFMNFDELNTHFSNNNFFSDSKLENPMYLFGTNLIVTVPVIDNLRMGYLMLGGSRTIEEEQSNGAVRGFEYDLSLNGINIDYGIKLFNHVYLFPGITGGWGTLDFISYKNDNDIIWSDFKPSADNENYMNSLTNNFFYVQPNIYLEYAITPLTMLRLSTGYIMSFMGDWNYNMNAEIKEVPKEINASSFGIQAGIFIGVFNY